MPRVSVKFEVPVRGVRYDISPTDMPPDGLRDSSNMVFRAGRFQPRFGLSSMSNAVGASVVGMISAGPTFKRHGNILATDTIVAGTTSGWNYYTTGPGWNAVTGALSTSNHIIFRLFPKSGAIYLIGLNDGVDVPKRWDFNTGPANLVSVGGNPAKAKAMMVLANRLMLFNLATASGYTGVVSDSAYDVSSFNDFDTGWSTVLNGLLIDTPGSIVGALEMGDLQGAIYKSDAVVMAVAQGGSYPFHFEWRSIGNIGPANQRCIVALRDGSHVYLGADGGVYRFDGVSVRPLDENTGHIKKAVLKAADPDLNNFTSKAWGFSDTDKNEVEFFFKRRDGSAKTTGSVNINMDNLSVWPQDRAFDNADVTAGGVVNIASDTRPRVAFFTNTTGKAWKEADNTMTDNASNVTCSWEYGYTDFGFPGGYKTITEMDHVFRDYTDDANYLTATGNQDILVSLGGMSDSGGEAFLESSQTMTIQFNAGTKLMTDHRSTALMASPRYIVSNAKIWDFRGAILHAQTRGER